MRIIRLISRFIIGSVFIFSGFVKAVDPLGSAYRFSDYFQAFHLDFLKFAGLPLAILMCTAEFITGISVLSGIRFRWGIIGAIILMAFFTPLTFILALTNPVSDCGCFGDAVHLTNWQTFGKNIILLSFVIVLFAGRKSIISYFKPAVEWLIIVVFALFFISFSFYNLRYLPVIDFLPYKTGTNIPNKMMRPEGASADQYATTFIYEKDGQKKDFTLKNYPASDTSWKFIEQKSSLIKKGYVPPIHDFTIVNMQTEDITGRILSNPGYTLLMITKKLSEADSGNLTKGFKTGMFCINKGIGFYVLSSSGSDELKSYNNGLIYCSTDETTLKTMMRANPGYILIKNGTIIGKWSWANLKELGILLKKIEKN
jgi:uncharacterized membrane protein YphA (DoxX/SURF4 family)